MCGSEPPGASRLHRDKPLKCVFSSGWRAPYTNHHSSVPGRIRGVVRMSDVVEGLRATEVEQVSAAQNKDVNQRHRQETALLGSQKGNIGAHIY